MPILRQAAPLHAPAIFLMTVTSFEPISDEQSRILILGTMPGRASLKAQEYYAHPDNLFWDVLFRLFEPSWDWKKPVDLDYSSKRNLLLRNNIAVWDVFKFCDRKGSLDVMIKNEVHNDLEVFLQSHPLITVICFNGQLAEKSFTSLLRDTSRLHNLSLFSLPSTSSSNTQNPFVKIQHWAVLHKYLNNSQ